MHASIKTTILAAMALAATPALAQDKVTFATNWLAQAEHGGVTDTERHGAVGLERELLNGYAARRGDYDRQWRRPNFDVELAHQALDRAR